MIQRKKGGGRPKTARTAQNVSAVDELALSEESQPITHRSVREIARETGIRQSSVFRFIHNDLRLKCLKKRRAQELTESNRANRLKRARMLLKMYPGDQVNFMWFTDDKPFTVAAPKNPQNDRLYVPVTTTKKEVAPKRLLCTRPTSSQSLMVSVGISKLGCTEIVFVDTCVAHNTATCSCQSYTRDARGIRGIVRLSTGQRPSTPGTRHCATSRAGNAGVHSTGSLTSKQP